MNKKIIKRDLSERKRNWSGAENTVTELKNSLEKFKREHIQTSR